MAQNFLLIDGSYFVFFRYYALLNWFKLAKKDQIIDKDNPPWENKEFVEKFKKTFVSKVAEIKQKLKIDNPITLIGKDCPRETIWRMKYLSSYKANRVYDDSFLGGPFFKMAYEDDLFIKGGANKIFNFPTLEADDCLAILSKRLLKSFPDANITIDFALARLTNILDNMIIYPKKMLENLNITKGLIFSQEVMLELTKSGLSREQSYRMVQNYAKKCFAENLDLFDVISSDKLIMKKITPKKLKSIFSYAKHFKNINFIFRRVFK